MQERLIGVSITFSKCIFNGVRKLGCNNVVLPTRKDSQIRQSFRNKTIVETFSSMRLLVALKGTKKQLKQETFDLRFVPRYSMKYYCSMPVKSVNVGKKTIVIQKEQQTNEETADGTRYLKLILTTNSL